VLFPSAALIVPAAAQDATILRYEALTELAVAQTSEVGAAAELKVSFSAFGARFATTLTRNDLLTRNLPPEIQQRLAGSEFYIGSLDGNASSWVRLMRTGAALSGAIFDGTEVYFIEPFGRVAAHVVAGPDVAPADAIIYRWADTLSALTDAVASPVIPAAPGGSQKPTIVPRVFDELASAQSKLTPAQQLNIGLLGDSEFVQMNGTFAESHLLSIANVVDGIFFGQVGVRISVAELRTYAEPDAFSTTDAAALLSQLGDFKLDTPVLRGQGLVHLLTGRDLDERPGTPAGIRLLGIANFGALCDERLSVSLTQFTSLGTAAIVAAHEIGHNFGAPHDAQAGSPCESTPDNFLMSPLFNGSHQFSQCSLQQMEVELTAATCFTNLTPIDVSVQRLAGPAEVVATRGFQLEFAVDYAGAADAIEPLLTMTSSNLTRVGFYGEHPASCDFGSTTPMTCRFARLPAAGGRVRFYADFVAPQAGPAFVDIEVTAANDYTPSNNRYRFDFEVAPDGRFVLASLSAPVAVKPNAVFDVDWVIANAGPISATNVRAEFRITDLFEVIEAQTPSGAGCARDPVSFDWLCPIGTVAPGANVPLKLKLRADDFPNMEPGSRTGGAIWLKMVAAEPVFAWQNLWDTGVTITPKIIDVYVDMTSPASALVGSSVTFAMRVGNRGPDDVSDVVAALSSYTGSGQQLALVSATSSRGSCAKEFWGEMVCRFATLASGETVDFSVQATVSMDAATHDVRATAGAPRTFDTDVTNNERRIEFRSTAPPPPAPTPSPPPTPTPAPDPPAVSAPAVSGGGGAVDLIMILLLLGAAVRRGHHGRGEPRRVESAAVRHRTAGARPGADAGDPGCGGGDLAFVSRRDRVVAGRLLRLDIAEPGLREQGL
jgi:hypothetical protein